MSVDLAELTVPQLRDRARRLLDDLDRYDAEAGGMRSTPTRVAIGAEYDRVQIELQRRYEIERGR